MTIHTASVAHKRAILAAAPDEASAAARRLGAEQRDAATFHDANLSAEGNQREALRRQAAVRDASAAEVQELRTRATDARDYLTRTLDQERPQISDYARAQASWSQATMNLGNGHTLQHVLANADEPLTLAVEEFGPHHLRAQRDPSKVWELRFATPDGDATDAAIRELRTAALERLAAVTADAALADLIAAN